MKDTKILSTKVVAKIAVTGQATKSQAQKLAIGYKPVEVDRGGHKFHRGLPTGKSK